MWIGGGPDDQKESQVRAEKLQEGQTLLQALEEEHVAQLRLRARQKEATAAFRAAWNAARLQWLERLGRLVRS